MPREKLALDHHPDPPPSYGGPLRYCHVAVCVGGMVATLIIGTLIGIGVGYWLIKPMHDGEGKHTVTILYIVTIHEW